MPVIRGHDVAGGLEQLRELALLRGARYLIEGASIPPSASIRLSSKECGRIRLG
jgi:hypothetical protein